MKVTVVARGARRYFCLRWRDPLTGKYREKKCQHRTRRLAEREAERWSQELEREHQRLSEGRDDDWDACVDTYLLSQRWSQASEQKFLVALGHLPRKPARVRDLKKPHLEALKAEQLRTKQPATVCGYLKRINAFLNFCCHELEVIDKVPKVRKPRLIRKARARPITGEEFERMLAACDKVRGDDAPAWRDFLSGLYLGGLRLDEARRLVWGRGAFSVLWGHNPPCFEFSAEQKNRKSSLTPMAPEFADLLRRMGPQKNGLVFGGLNVHTRAGCGRVVTQIGRAARVVTSTDRNAIKYASAHDLRRSFATRWASLLPAAELRELMRHGDVKTTLDFYVEFSVSSLTRKLETVSDARKVDGTAVEVGDRLGDRAWEN